MNNKSLLGGFTLVELMLVILLMSSLALVATAFVDNAEQQLNFEQTKTKLEQIRRAIIGNSSQTLNGEPVLTGFVADMGRLPESLSELVEPLDAARLWNETSLPNSGGFEVTFHGGWRGPYLDAMPESSSGIRAFRDGWGNQAETDDSENYGWIYRDGNGGTGAPEAKVFVQSLGADFAADDPLIPSADPYMRDYPAEGKNLIDENDWRVDVTGHEIRVALNRISSISTDSLALKLFRLEVNATKEIKELAEISLGPGPILGIQGSQILSGNFPTPADPSERIYLPTGMIAAVVVCEVSGNIYKGDCDTPPYATPPLQYFKIVPRSYRPPLQITWNTQ